jgi:hypothetical protein
MGRGIEKEREREQCVCVCVCASVVCVTVGVVKGLQQGERERVSNVEEIEAIACSPS